MNFGQEIEASLSLPKSDDYKRNIAEQKQVQDQLSQLQEQFAEK